MSTVMSSPIRTPRLRLGDLLVRRGFLTPERLNEALRVQSEGGMSGNRVPFAVRAAGHSDVRSQGRGTAASRIHRKARHPAIVQDSRYVDRRRRRTVRRVSAGSPEGKLEGFKWDTPSSDKTISSSLVSGRYDTSGLKSAQRLACAADFSKKAQAVQDSDPEQARFFNDQAAKVTAGESVDVACTFQPMPTVPEPVVSAQMQQTEKNIQTVQLDIKELQGIETKVQKIQSDKSAAQQKVQQAEAARQQAESDKAGAKPEDAALLAEILRRQAEAQAQLDDANQKLKALSDQEQELSQRKEAILQELQQIQQQNRSGEAGAPQ